MPAKDGTDDRTITMARVLRQYDPTPGPAIDAKWIKLWEGLALRQLKSWISSIRESEAAQWIAGTKLLGDPNLPNWLVPADPQLPLNDQAIADVLETIAEFVRLGLLSGDPHTERLLAADADLGESRREELAAELGESQGELGRKIRRARNRAKNT